VPTGHELLIETFFDVVLGSSARSLSDPDNITVLCASSSGLRHQSIMLAQWLAGLSTSAARMWLGQSSSEMNQPMIDEGVKLVVQPG
jgi:hypothetical protein